MAIIKTSTASVVQATRPRHRAGGFSAEAVCVDFIDHGIRTTPFGPKPQFTFVFETELEKDNGFRATAKKTFTKSLHELSALRPFVEAWLGRKLTQDEVDGQFRPSSLMGRTARLSYDRATSSMGYPYLAIKGIAPGIRCIRPSGYYKRFINN